MRIRPSRRALALACALIVAALPSFAADLEKSWTFEGDELAVANMIGAVTVTGTSGDAFTVKVTVRGDDAVPGLIDFVVEEGREAHLIVKFPVDKHDDYIYPELGSKSKTSIRFRDGDEDDSWLRKVFQHGDKITVRGKGGGLEVWADVEIGVPEGGSLEVRHGVGTIDAAGVTGDLNLDTQSGPVTATDIKGDVLVDTGSGSVKVKGVVGNVNVDTGSGSVAVADVKGDKVLVDTGSGSVEVKQVDCANLHVDTGSGSVKARSISTDKAKIDTGSGSVVLELDRMGPGRYVIDTGSGSIELALPKNASARIEADTGSGKVRNKIQDADVKHLERDELLMTVGDGEARVTLDAGSGSITIRRI